jgi:hypothetical protein
MLENVHEAQSIELRIGLDARGEEHLRHAFTMSASIREGVWINLTSLGGEPEQS